MKNFLQLTLKQALHNLHSGEGGPFGAVIVKNNKVISQAHNTVMKDNDPTAHAEINAIRQACKKLKTYHLADCVLYTNAEPCPMCLAAAYWARIKKIFYINSKEEVKKYTPFIDAKIYKELCSDEKSISLQQISTDHAEGLQLLKQWQKENKDFY